MATQDSRIKLKRSTIAATVPTVPSSNDHTDGTWIATDIYKGELFYNQADNILYTRDDSGIVVLGGAGGGGNLDNAYDYGGLGVGRSVTADNGAVKIEGADGLLVTGVLGSGAVSEWVGGGAYDSGMFFNPAKGAFRAGEAASTEWDDANIGDASFAAGSGNIASGFASASFGSGNQSTGDGSFTCGGSNIASAVGSVAMGSDNQAIEESASSFGNLCESKGRSSFSTGLWVLAESLAEMATGMFNTNYTPTSTTTWEATDRLFGIGNGTADGARADAFIITKNGNLTMPTTTGAFSPPVMTTTERNALTATAGMMVFNSTTSKHQGYDGSAWNDLY